MGCLLKRRGVLHAGGVVIASSLSGCGMFSTSTPSEEARYVFARVVDEAPAKEEIADYSDQRVQENEYARELVPEAVSNSNGYAERRVPNGETDPISELSTGYIAYEDHIVRILLRTED